jgi:type I restriction enzyme S subunit
MIPQYQRISEGTNVRRRKAKFEDFAQIPVPLPSLPEQQAIAHVLRIVQKAIETTEKVIEATRELKRSLMNHLFTYGPVPVDEAERVPLKETEIGPVPVHWEVAKVGDVARVGNGSTPKRTNTAYWKGGTLPWLTSGKVHETIIEQADEFVTELAQEECHLPLVPRESVVVAITGQGKTLGNAAMVMFDTCVSQHLAYVRFQTSYVAPEFVLAFLQQRYEELRRASRAGGSTKGALTCGFLKSYPLPLPTLEEQQEIAHHLSVVNSKIAAEENRKRTLEVLFKTLLHNLMTGKVRVGDLNLYEVGELV